jgi:hypothetical protein
MNIHRANVTMGIQQAEGYNTRTNKAAGSSSGCLLQPNRAKVV